VEKYERVEFSKEKPKKSGWYYVTDNVSCLPDNAFYRHYLADQGYFVSDGKMIGLSVGFSYWFRKLRPTTGLTLGQAIRAMEKGKCIQVGIGEIVRIYDGKLQQWAINGSGWNELSWEVNYRLKWKFSIVPDPSKVEPEPEREEVEREVFGFEEMVKRCTEGKTCVRVDCPDIKITCRSGNPSSSSLVPVIYFGDEPMLTTSVMVFQCKFYEVKE